MADCVTLNIWRPSGVSQDSKLPVVVYIHVSLSALACKIFYSRILLQGGGNYYNVRSSADYGIVQLTICSTPVSSRLPDG